MAYAPIKEIRIIFPTRAEKFSAKRVYVFLLQMLCKSANKSSVKGRKVLSSLTGEKKCGKNFSPHMYTHTHKTEARFTVLRRSPPGSGGHAPLQRFVDILDDGGIKSHEKCSLQLPLQRSPSFFDVLFTSSHKSSSLGAE